MHHFIMFLLLLLAPFFSALAAAATAIERGKALYATKCVVCHSLDYNSVGPAHRGVFGRKAGLAKDYAYSTALMASSIIWDDKTLNRWLANPETLIPGQKMGISVANANERRDLIAYLKGAAK